MLSCQDQICIFISIHAPRARGDLKMRQAEEDWLISIHAPRARGDRLCHAPGLQGLISIHAPRARGDSPAGQQSYSGPNFNPRPSCEGRLVGEVHPGLQRHISIHAPRARGDAMPSARSLTKRNFNPRPSCEGRPSLICESPDVAKFQSTPLVRGATVGYVTESWERDDFNPRPSCEGRQF